MIVLVRLRLSKAGFGRVNSIYLCDMTYEHIVFSVARRVVCIPIIDKSSLFTELSCIKFNSKFLKNWRKLIEFKQLAIFWKKTILWTID